MLDTVLRVLLGFVILGIGAWIGQLLFGLLGGLVNGAAYFLARGVRKLFGVNGTWPFGLGAALTGTSIGRGVFEFCFYAALFLSVLAYIFQSQTLANIASFFAGGIFFSLLVIWMPSVFLLGLFAPGLGEE